MALWLFKIYIYSFYSLAAYVKLISRHRRVPALRRLAHCGHLVRCVAYDRACGKIKLIRALACHDKSGKPITAGGRPVALHAYYRVHNIKRRLDALTKVNKHGAERIAVIEPKMQLRLVCARYRAEQVLYRAGIARHGMCLELWKVYQNIRIKDRIDYRHILYRVPAVMRYLRKTGIKIKLRLCSLYRLIHTAGAINTPQYRRIVRPAGAFGYSHTSACLLDRVYNCANKVRVRGDSAARTFS